MYQIRSLVCGMALAVCAVSLCGGGAAAQQIPPVSTGPATVTVRQVDGRIEMRDAATDELIMAPRAMQLHAWPAQGETLRPTVTVQTQPNGFDVIYRFRNQSTRPQPLGSLRLGVFTLGQRVTHQDFGRDGQPLTSDYANTHAWAECYPGTKYSPVVVLRNSRYAVGVSLHYPVLEYKHDARLGHWSPAGPDSVGQGGRGWAIEARLSPFGDEQGYTRMTQGASMAPGEERTYVMSVRVEKRPDEWIRTLEPYRDYFQSMYGGVRYQRDARPVRGLMTAATYYINASNPFGFMDERTRPDVHGFGPIANQLIAQRNVYDRVMLWSPTGMYRRNQHNNYPFQFTTQWLEGAQRGHNMGDAVQKLNTVPAAGLEMGLWWGRAAQVMRVWEAENSEPFRPGNPEHVQRALAEVDLAVQAGATVIGLDAFTHGHCRVWELYGWLQQMQERHPQVKYITEGRNPDVMHVLAPTYITAYNVARNATNDQQFFHVRSPLFLADFLLPGHETWCGLPFNRLGDYWRRPATHQDRMNEVHRVAAMGYVPVIAWPNFDVRSVRAAESWRNTVPSDLLNYAESQEPDAAGDPVPAPAQQPQQRDRSPQRQTPLSPVGPAPDISGGQPGGSSPAGAPRSLRSPPRPQAAPPTTKEQQRQQEESSQSRRSRPR